MKDYNQLSETGRQVLFNSTGRTQLARALDDISKVSVAFQRLQKFANPSGTAQNRNFMELAQSVSRSAAIGTGAMVILGPVKVVAGVVGARAMAHVLASPATARSMARWSKAYEAAVRRPTRGTLRSMQVASRQFGDSLARSLGFDANSVATKLQGAMQGAAAEDEND